ncbi:MAG: hypothetical protein ACRDZT_06945 [Acidimicrobiales bacterium]
MTNLLPVERLPLRLQPAPDSSGPLQHDESVGSPSSSDPACLALDRLRVEAWPDPVVDEIGHDPRSSYVEIFWLPVLGPPNIGESQ